MNMCKQIILRFRHYLRALLFIYVIISICLTFWWTSGRAYREAQKDKFTKTNLDQYAVKGHTKLQNDLRHEMIKEIKATESVFTWPAVNNDAYFKDIFGKVKTFCNGSFEGYDGTFAKLSNVIVDPKFAHGRTGGENISSVLNQAEKEEYFTLSNGYFKLRCNEGFKYQFKSKSHLSTWINYIDFDAKTDLVTQSVNDWTIAVLRYEYVNLYHTMTDFYNAFLVAKMFKMDPDKTLIVWIDGHPVGGLDSTWSTLFGNTTRAGKIKEPMLFKRMVWGIMGYDSPLNHHDLPLIPYTEEFRNFFLTRHGVNCESKLSCDTIKVTFLWRRDYLAHPRNPSGEVSRKIKNEDELMTAVRDLLPGHSVNGVQIDKLAMRQQLETISNTDILIGMHGAGLTHTLFLPQHAALIELFPTYWSSANKHFRTMAKWRHLHYSTWTNTDSSKELPHKYTVVDVKAVVNMVHEMHHKLCQGNADV